VDGQLGLEREIDDYVSELVRVFAAVRRVSREDGTVFLNVGDGYMSGGRTSRAPDAKNPNRAVGTRPPTPARLKPKDLLCLPYRIALALQQPFLGCPVCGFEDHAMKFGRMLDGADICPGCRNHADAVITTPGWYLRSDIISQRPNCQPGSMKDRPTQEHEHIWLLAKSERYVYDHTAYRGPNDRNLRTIWSFNNERGSTGHVAPFPKELRFCGIELNPDYVEAAVSRLDLTRAAAVKTVTKVCVKTVSARWRSCKRTPSPAWRRSRSRGTVPVSNPRTMSSVEVRPCAGEIGEVENPNARVGHARVERPPPAVRRRARGSLALRRVATAVARRGRVSPCPRQELASPIEMEPRNRTASDYGQLCSSRAGRRRARR
jgi:DNA methylase